MSSYIHTNPNLLGLRISKTSFKYGWRTQWLWPYRTWHRFHSDPLPLPLIVRDPRTRDLQWTHSSGPPQIHTPAHSRLPPASQCMDGAAQDKAGEHVSCPRHWQHSSELLSCWEPAFLFPALRLNTREHSPAWYLLHTLCREVSVRMGPSYRDRVSGLLSPQRSHYHVIGSRGDTVCMESLGRLQWGQILPPVLLTLIHAWGLVTTPGNYWEGPCEQLSRGQGEFSEFPVGELKFTVKVIAGGGTLTEHQGSLHCVSRWAFSLRVSLFQTVPKCVHTNDQHGIWRLGFLLSWSSTALSIYGLRPV